MWKLNVNEPERDAYWAELKPGSTLIGRGSQNAIAVWDASASRQHAEIEWDEKNNVITIEDLDSANGTYVNRKRIEGKVALKNGDNIRIGRAMLHLTNEDGETRVSLAGTHAFTREIILESLDEHAILIDEVARKLSSLMDVFSMRREVVVQIKRILMMEDVRVTLAEEFSTLTEEEARRAVESRAVEVTPLQMFVPIADGDQTLGLITLTRKANARPFTHRDMGLATAISHQAALTLNRLKLLEKNREQERMRELLLRFVSPLEVEYLLKDYLATGKLPEFDEEKVTILFCDIANSTALAERIGSQRFAQLLTRYYQDATTVVFRYGGIIKYIGDGVMAAFVSTSKTQTVVPQEIRGTQAGLQILRQLSRREYELDGERIVVGVAVNTGPAMVGYIGVGPRAEFTVLGDTVNIASRMEGYARPNRLLIGPDTLKIVQGRFQVRPFGEIEMRGKSVPVPAFEVVSDG